MITQKVNLYQGFHNPADISGTGFLRTPPAHSLMPLQLLIGSVDLTICIPASANL
jgi:hypothetical protein